MSLERWKIFSKREQLLFIGSELERARVWGEEGNQENFLGALMRAADLVALTAQDEKWSDDIEKPLFLREELMKLSVGESIFTPAQIYQAL